MNDQAPAPLICPTCHRPLTDTPIQGAFPFPLPEDFSEAQRERIRLIVLEVLRALRAAPPTIPGDLR